MEEPHNEAAGVEAVAFVQVVVEQVGVVAVEPDVDVVVVVVVAAVVVVVAAAVAPSFAASSFGPFSN